MYCRSFTKRLSCTIVGFQGARNDLPHVILIWIILEQRIFPQSSIFPIARRGATVLGMALPSPAKPEEVLEILYGYKKLDQ